MPDIARVGIAWYGAITGHAEEPLGGYYNATFCTLYLPWTCDVIRGLTEQ